MATQSTPPLPQIDGYELLRRLNAGGAASVFEAQRHFDGKRFAVKLIPRDANAMHYDRFAVETQVGMRLRHPDIVRVHDHGETARFLWIAMDLLDGVDLSDAMQEGLLLDCETRLSIVVRVARALQAAHDEGVLHRDVKPSNIFLTSDGGVRLLDFGISKVIGFDITQSDIISGTPGYIAPEILQGHDVDTRADTFSLAVVAYELLAGQPPWPRAAIYETMLAVCTRPPESLMLTMTQAARFTLKPSVLNALHRTIHRALSSEPQRRHATASEFADELEEVLAQVKAPSSRLRQRAMRPVVDDRAQWAGRRLDWAKARAERALNEASGEFTARPEAPDEPSLSRSATDSSTWLWGLLIAAFTAGAAAALLRLAEL